MAGFKHHPGSKHTPEHNYFTTFARSLHNYVTMGMILPHGMLCDSPVVDVDVHYIALIEISVNDTPQLAEVGQRRRAPATNRSPIAPARRYL
jgi:hypothetical protein